MNGQTSRELPKYQSHKIVWALKIKGIASETSTADNKILHFIIPEDAQYAPIEVDEEYFSKHKPTAGGYYVVYEDGYKSFSPAEAFESGYTLIN